MQPLAIVCLILIAAARNEAAEIRFDFARTPLNTMPAGFTSVLGGEGPPGEWKIVEDVVTTPFRSLTTQAALTEKRPVLAQLSRDPTDERFPMLVYEGETFADFTFSTRFKLVSGEKEQMAGVAFRMKDERNYYYVRASALGGTFRFFKVVDGQRGPPIGPEIRIGTGVWHELSVQCRGSRIQVLLNGQAVLPELTDHSFAAGRIAFWTKSDSVAYFADAGIVYKPVERVAQTILASVMNKYSRLAGLKIIGRASTNEPLQIIASTDKTEVGRKGDDFIEDVLASDKIYYAKEKRLAIVTMPLRDRNGETIAAVRVLLDSFRGQTEQNALARALPVVKSIEERIRSVPNLYE